MTVAQDIMTRNPVTCRQDDTVLDAVQVMKSQDTGVVPVVDENDRCCGIITDRDICLEVILNEREPKRTRLQEIMHRNLLTCKPQDDLNEVINQMKRRQVKRILITDQNDRCMGIISEHDIARHANRETVGELAEGVFG